MPPATRIRGIQISDNTVTAADIDYTLDEAYDNGGSGSGRTITADSGPVVVNATSDIASALVVTGTVTATGEIISMGKLRSDLSSGDEGGEILLNKPVTNTNLVGNGVTIDVYQNKLRFFEQGGSARGYYLDITNGGSAASTNLGASSATPGGSDTHVQFNDGGGFGGDAGLTYNKTTDTLTIAGDLAVNGGDLTTTATTFNLVNATATTVNLGGGASAINIGAAGSATTFAGNVTGSNIVLTGDLTGSNIRLTGDIAVVGGDLTSTAATFNLATNLATQLNVGGTTPTISIGTSTGTSTTGLATGTNTNSLTIKNVNIGTGTGASATVNVNIGSSGSLGRTTLNNDVFLATGNIIGSPGISGSNAMALISSGNIIAKLDTNNDATGHKFVVQDWGNIEQFSVNENGNAEISGSLVVSGSSIQTVTTTTYNLLTTALTGTLNVGSLASSIIVGGTTTTSSFTGATQVDGRSTLSSVTEKLVPSVGGTGTVAYDLSLASIFYANGPTGAITANFTNVPTTNNRIITPTVILSQSATPRIVSAVQIDTVAQTINWANGTTPTGTANKQDVFGFSLIRSGSAWKVLGQMSTYG